MASLPEEVLGSAELSETVTPPAEASPRRLREASQSLLEQQLRCAVRVFWSSVKLPLATLD